VNCPKTADAFFTCMGRAGADHEAGVDCMLKCVGDGIKAKK
jgi:hypothetical protein